MEALLKSDRLRKNGYGRVSNIDCATGALQEPPLLL